MSQTEEDRLNDEINTLRRKLRLVQTRNALNKREEDLDKREKVIEEREKEYRIAKNELENQRVTLEDRVRETIRREKDKYPSDVSSTSLYVKAESPDIGY